MAEPAPEPPHRRDAEAQEPLGDRAGIHDVGGDDEERDSEKQEALIDAVEKVLADDPDRLAGGQHIGYRGEDDGIGHGHPDAGEDEERADAEQEFHAHSSVIPRWWWPSGPTPWRRMPQARQR